MTLGAIYNRHLGRNRRAIWAHLPRLRALAEGLDLAVEFGVKGGASSSALLMGARRVISYDIAETEEARELEAVAHHWDYRIQSSLEAEPVECDMLFIDSDHTYRQCKAELDRHADLVRRRLVFHDTLTFGSVGSVGDTGRQSWPYVQGQTVPAEHLGLRPAIDELMIRDTSWVIAAHFLDYHGLLVLERRKA